MAKLAKATLLRLDRKRPAKGGQPETVAPEGDPIAVQFNPTSLRLQQQSNYDRGGLNTKAQRRQYPSVQPATLSFDLEFDTAEDEQPNPNAGGRRTSPRAASAFWCSWPCTATGSSVGMPRAPCGRSGTTFVPRVTCGPPCGASTAPASGC